jgi:hypothetical protein
LKFVHALPPATTLRLSQTPWAGVASSFPHFLPKIISQKIVRFFPRIAICYREEHSMRPPKSPSQKHHSPRAHQVSASANSPRSLTTFHSRPCNPTFPKSNPLGAPRVSAHSQPRLNTHRHNSSPSIYGSFWSANISTEDDTSRITTLARRDSTTHDDNASPTPFRGCSDNPARRASPGGKRCVV